MKERPSLFGYATSELSQDAFFAWLMAWADTDCGTDKAEHKLGRNFLTLIFDRAGVECPEGEMHVTVKTQYEKIDVFCTVNEQTAIIFEDKVNTAEHDDQLARYRKIIEKQGKYDNIITVYCKTGDECRLGIKKKTSKIPVIIDRGDLLEMFQSNTGRNARDANVIIADYANHIESIERSVLAYATKPTDKWGWYEWIGFFKRLEVRMALIDPKGFGWDYVPNPSGGFLGFWWSWHGVEGGDVYLQLEEGKGCFKVAVTNGDPQTLKCTWSERLVKTSAAMEGLPFKVVRPKVLRVGSYMTVAVLDRDYRIEKDGLLDLEATLANIHKMEELVNKAVLEYRKESAS